MLADHNLRAKKQWSIIRHSVVFTGKRVIDIGSGYCDLATHIIRDSAPQYVVCIEKDTSVYLEASARLRKRNQETPGIQDRLILSHTAFEDFTDVYPGKFDIGICFSVLPYVSNKTAFLRWFLDNCETTLIEFQYYGDGPYALPYANTEQAKTWLETYGWGRVAKIGETLVEERKMVRDIWMCEL